MALIGREKKFVHSAVTLVLQALARNRTDKKVSTLFEVRRLLTAHMAHIPSVTHDAEIVAVLTDVAMELNLSYEEWTSVIRIRGVIHEGTEV